MNNMVFSMNDAALYYEKAVQAMERYQYDKAIKNFQRVLQLEPDNPVHACNLAGALAENGKYAESNRLLLQVIDHLDPSMTECHFYIANNYANMENWSESEQHIIEYLENDEEGLYFDDCQELLDFFVNELGRAPAKIEQIKCRQGIDEHDQARALLEAGQFAEAIELLKKIIAEIPDFLSARNNLAIAHIYTGEFSEAERHILYVLGTEPDNLHALCNYAMVLHHEKRDEELNALLVKLAECKPSHGDQLFKLATTMGILNRDDIAYQLYRSITRKHFQDVDLDDCFYHYTAVSAWNVGLLDEARMWWMKARKQNPKSNVISFFLFHVGAWISLGHQPPVKLKYQFQLPFSDLLRTLHRISKLPTQKDGLIEKFLMDSFAWALRNGEPEVKKLVSEGLFLIGYKPINEALGSLGFLLGENQAVNHPAASMTASTQAETSNLMNAFATLNREEILVGSRNSEEEFGWKK